MRDVAILVDGGFYLKRYKWRFGRQNEAKKITKDLLTHCLKHINKREQERLYRIFFYDCPPLIKKIKHPITNDEIDLSETSLAQFRFDLHTLLKQTRNVALRLGRLDEKNARWRVKSPKKQRDLIANPHNTTLDENDIVYHAIQKVVDMKIGLDVASLAYKKLVKKIVLISGDSDFAPAAKLARMEGIEVILDAMYATINIDLQEHIDGFNTTLPKKNEFNTATEDY